jgi:hypothetical protein
MILNSLSPLTALSQLDPNKIWKVDSKSPKKIVCVKKNGSLIGKIRQIIEFNKVMKFVQSALQGRNQNEVKPFVNNIFIEYHQIKKEAAKEKFIITRLVLNILQLLYHFDRTHHDLQEKAKQLPKIEASTLPKTSPTNTQQALSINKPSVYHAPLRGGIANGGNTCFIAAALQCLCSRSDQLPKDVENDLKRKYDETNEQFAQRKKLANEVLKLINKITMQKRVSGEEINELRTQLNKNNPLITKENGGDSRIVLEALFDLFALPSFNISFSNKPPALSRLFYSTIEDKSRSIKLEMIDFDDLLTNTPASKIEPIKTLDTLPNLQPNYKPTLKEFTLKEDESYLANFTIEESLTRRLPSYFPLMVVRAAGYTTNVHISKLLRFPNLEGVYELVAGQNSNCNHAYALVNENDQWVKYDDENISIITEFEALKELEAGCSLLLYKLKKFVV